MIPVVVADPVSCFTLIDELKETLPKINAMLILHDQRVEINTM